MPEVHLGKGVGCCKGGLFKPGKARVDGIRSPVSIVFFDLYRPFQHSDLAFAVLLLVIQGEKGSVGDRRQDQLESG